MSDVADPIHRAHEPHSAAAKPTAAGLESATSVADAVSGAPVVPRLALPGGGGARREAEHILRLQRVHGNQAVSQMIRGARSTPTPASPSDGTHVARLLSRQVPQPTPDTLPPPVAVQWSTDPFEISFERVREGGSARFSFAVRYVGAAKTSGPFVTGNTCRIGVLIGDAPINARIAGRDLTSLSVDLYGDGRRVVKLIDRARVDTRPGTAVVSTTWAQSSTRRSTRPVVCGCWTPRRARRTLPRGGRRSGRARIQLPR